MTKRKWITVAIIVPITLALLGLGFAAMSTNSPLPNWVPAIFFISAGLLAFSLIIYLLFPVMKRIPEVVSKLIRKRLRLKIEIYDKPQREKVEITLYPKSAIELSASELAENVLFIKDFQAVVKKLDRNVSGNYVNSASNILQNVCSLVNDKMSKAILISQDAKLLKNENWRLEEDVHQFKTKADTLTCIFPITQMQEDCHKLKQLVIGYYDSVKEIRQFLSGLQQQGIPPIWESDQWNKTTYPALVSDFNTLTELIRTLRNHTAKNLLPYLLNEDSLQTLC